MKLIIYIAMIILLSSCGLDTNRQTEQNKKKNTSYKNQNTKRLLGDWGIYVHIANGVAINCNVCPRIIFNNTDTAILTLPSGDKETYKWSEINNTLKTEFVGDKMSEPYLADSEYKIKFNQKEKSVDLTLSLSVTEQYILSK